MGLRSFLLCISLLQLTTAPKSTGLREIPVQIQQRVFLHIPSIQLENGTEIGWFSCPAKNCHPHWNEHFLADIVFMKKASVDDPNFEAYPNGTLVIKNFRPIYDERNFILLARLENITSKPYIYRPTTIKGSPKLTLVSPQDIYVYVRMDLYLEAQVEGYPYPWVSLSHDQHVLQNRSNFMSSNILLKVNSNITKANGGLYIICAGNPYGNHCLIKRVHVQDIPIPTLPPSSGDVSRSDPPDSSKSPPPGMMDNNDKELNGKSRPEMQAPPNGALINIPTNAAMNVTVRIQQRFLLACSALSYQEGVTDIGWYRCSTDDCDEEWDKNWIAHVQNMRERVADNSSFEVYTNGTLVIKKVQPVDDGKVFICKVRRPPIGLEQANTILRVAREKPQLILESSTTLHVMEGKDLHLNARVQGYPFPRVTWSHHGHLLKDTSNVQSETSLKIRNVKVSERGLYTCYAENPIGHDSLTMNVDVEGQPRTTTTDSNQPVTKTTESDQPVTKTAKSDQPVTKTTESDQPVTKTTESEILFPSSSPTSGDSSITGWEIAGIVIGALVVVLIIICCVSKKCCRVIRPYFHERFFRSFSEGLAEVP